MVRASVLQSFTSLRIGTHQISVFNLNVTLAIDLVNSAAVHQGTTTASPYGEERFCFCQPRVFLSVCHRQRKMSSSILEKSRS